MKKNNLWKLAGALALTAVLAGCSSSISQIGRASCRDRVFSLV